MRFVGKVISLRALSIKISLLSFYIIFPSLKYLSTGAYSISIEDPRIDSCNHFKTYWFLASTSVLPTRNSKQIIIQQHAVSIFVSQPKRIPTTTSFHICRTCRSFSRSQFQGLWTKNASRNKNLFANEQQNIRFRFMYGKSESNSCYIEISIVKIICEACLSIISFAT